ncbi:MAG: MFS transporter, partial [Candidatus Sulfotelmatobacter sp.]
AASAWMRIASIVGPIIVGAILGGAGLPSVFLFFGASAFVGAAIVFLFAVETKQKVLEEISR